MDADRCRQVIERCMPGMRIRDMVLMPHCRDSLALEVNAEYVCRFPRHAAAEAQLAQEIALLPELAKALPVRVPVIAFVAHGERSRGTTFIAYRRIPGVSLSVAYLHPVVPEAVVEQLAAVLSALHSFPVARATRCGVQDASPATWPRRYEELYRCIGRRVFPLLSPKTRIYASEQWQAFLECKDGLCFQPVLIHGNLCAEHILFDPASVAITGITAWADATIGDPALDYAGLLRDYGPEFARQILDRYDGRVDTGFWDRVVFYSRADLYDEIQFALMMGEEGRLRYGLECLEGAQAAGGS